MMLLIASKASKSAAFPLLPPALMPSDVVALFQFPKGAKPKAAIVFEKSDTSKNTDDWLV